MSVLVFAENSDGIFKKSTLEAISYAKEVAKITGGNCTAISIGNVNEEQLSLLAKNGAEKIISFNHDSVVNFNAEVFSKIIAETAKSENSKTIVFSNTYSGKSVAPRTAATLKAAIVSGVISYPDLSNGFTVKRTVFSGKAFANVNMSSEIKVISITPNSFVINETNDALNIVPASNQVDANDFKTKSIEVSKASGKIALTEAELVISGGRGLKGPENWHLVEDLANALGAATACSKPVSDMHWRPHSEHVGQTGITIKPNLYIAIGISGAIQHLAGVSSSKVIVAINKDPEAPFFKAADYGIVGDAFDVLPAIINAAKNRA
jgi:electron transfer flavoprotein alpha subunit